MKHQLLSSLKIRLIFNSCLPIFSFLFVSLTDYNNEHKLKNFILLLAVLQILFKKKAVLKGFKLQKNKRLFAFLNFVGINKVFKQYNDISIYSKQQKLFNNKINFFFF
jgi:hypothetical protein